MCWYVTVWTKGVFKVPPYTSGPAASVAAAAAGAAVVAAAAAAAASSSSSSPQPISAAPARPSPATAVPRSIPRRDRRRPAVRVQ